MPQVIQKIGLCIGFYDLLESSDGLIGHGNGLVNVNGKLTLRSALLFTKLIAEPFDSQVPAYCISPI